MLQAINRCRRSSGPRSGYNTEHQLHITRRVLAIRDTYYAINVVAMFILSQYIWRAAGASLEPSPLWLTFWLRADNHFISAIIIIFCISASSVVAAIVPRSRWVRIAVAVSVTFAAAFYNSFGSSANGLHIWLWMAIVFAAFPSVADDVVLQSKRLRMQAIWTFISAQALVLSFYTLSGIFKVLSAIPASTEYYSSLSPYALSAHVARRLAQTGTDSITGEFLVQNPFLVWPIFLFVLYIELFAIVAIFRTQALQVTGVVLMVFHIGIWFSMNIHFYLQPVQVLLLFVWSPFLYPGKQSFTDVAASMPVLGMLFKALHPKQKVTKNDWHYSVLGLGLIVGILALCCIGKFLLYPLATGAAITLGLK